MNKSSMHELPRAPGIGAPGHTRTLEKVFRGLESKAALAFFAVLVASAAFGAGVVIEANTHALQISRITGTPYATVLNAWGRLQASGMSDTDCQAFDDEVNEGGQL